MCRCSINLVIFIVEEGQGYEEEIWCCLLFRDGCFDRDLEIVLLLVLAIFVKMTILLSSVKGVKKELCEEDLFELVESVVFALDS